MSVLFDLFITFFQIGITTFGGGYAMIPLVQSFMLEKGWLTQTEVIDFIAISEMTPGPFAINVATFCGAKTAGLAGSIAATAGVVFPSFIIVLAIAAFFANLNDKPQVKGVMAALRPAVVGLIATAAISIGEHAYFPDGIDMPIDPKAIIFTVVALIAIKKFKINPIFAILLSGVVGAFVYI